MLGYVLVSYGPRPDRDIRNCVAAQRQIRNLQAVAKAQNKRLRIVHDYRRTVTSLKDLPNLRKGLVSAKSVDGDRLVVTSLSEILQKPRVLDRARFLDDLMIYGDDIYGVREKGLLSSFTHGELVSLLTVAKPLLRIAPPKSRVAEEHRSSAAKASRAAQYEKSLRSAQAGAELAAIRAELVAQGRPSNLKHVAEEANLRGLHTQRGTGWTEATVSYQFRKLEE